MFNFPPRAPNTPDVRFSQFLTLRQEQQPVPPGETLRGAPSCVRPRFLSPAWLPFTIVPSGCNKPFPLTCHLYMDTGQRKQDERNQGIFQRHIRGTSINRKEPPAEAGTARRWVPRWRGGRQPWAGLQEGHAGRERGWEHAAASLAILSHLGSPVSSQAAQPSGVLTQPGPVYEKLNRTPGPG